MPRPLDSTDLLRIRGAAADMARRHRRPDWADDYVSAACARLVTLELPDEPKHRARFIGQTVCWEASDFYRKNCGTPRHLFGKAYADLSERQRLSVRFHCPLEDWDGAQSDTPAHDPDDLAAAQDALASIGATHPQEFAVLVLYFRHGMTLPDIGPALGVTPSRAHQIYVKGLALVQKRFQKQSHA